MGAWPEQVEVWIPNEEGASPRRTWERFRGFDANFADCTLDDDRERLLAAIEAGFGSIDTFNYMVSAILCKVLKNSKPHMAKDFRTSASTNEEDTDTKVKVRRVMYL